MKIGNEEVEEVEVVVVDEEEVVEQSSARGYGNVERRYPSVGSRT